MLRLFILFHPEVLLNAACKFRITHTTSSDDSSSSLAFPIEHFRLFHFLEKHIFIFFCRLVYFMDAKTDILEHVSYDGLMRTKVVKKSAVIHPFALTMFEDYIYYSDWSKPAGIMRISKTKTGGKFVIAQDLNKPMNLKVVHPVLQQVSVNHCATNNCSHLCVLKPNGYSCRCPLGMELDEDDTTCKGGFSFAFVYKITC